MEADDSLWRPLKGTAERKRRRRRRRRKKKKKAAAAYQALAGS